MKTICLLLLLLLPFSLAAQEVSRNASTEKTKTENSTVSGMVVKLEGSEPLRKARAQLTSVDDRTRSISAVTDAGGRFQIKGIEPGRYKLMVNRNGFVAYEYGQKKPNDPGAVLTLRPGQELKDLVFRLIPAAVIAGRILDEDGEPLASVAVSAAREVYSEGKRTLSTSTVAATDDLGGFRLFGLSPGHYIVSAVYPHWGRYGPDTGGAENEDPSQQGYAKMYYPGTVDPSKAIPLSIKPGEELSSIEILMRQVVVYHVRGHVYNQITHRTGTEANVFLMPKKRGLEWDFFDNQAMVEKKDGSFDISEVLPGSYILNAMWFDEGKSFSARVPVEVGNANVDGISVTIGAGVNISGRIIWDGQPSLENGELTVTPKPADTTWHFWGGGTRVDANNAFVLKDISDGTYFAELSGESKDCYIKDVHYGPSSALDEGFTVVRGAPANLEITVSSRGARVQGSVADADGLPAAGVQVVLVPEESRRTIHRLYKSETTDQYGRFDLRGIPPGNYKLFSWEEVEPGAWEDPDFLRPFETKGETAVIKEGEQQTVNLTAIRTKKTEPTP